MAKETNMDTTVHPCSQTTSGRINAPHLPDRQSSSEFDVDVNGYTDILQQAAREGDWNAAKRIIDGNENALTATITPHGMTALHLAARNGRSEFVERLVEKLPSDALAKHDNYGRNALHYIATVGTARAAQKMVEKNPNLTQEMDNERKTPIAAAVLLGFPHRRWEMVRFLANETKNKAPSYAFTGELSAQLILGIVYARFYDIALDLTKRYPKLRLAMDDGETILQVIAKDPSAFDSGSKISFWKRLFHPRESIKIEQNEKLRQENLRSLLQNIFDAISHLDNKEKENYMDTLTPIVHLAAENGLDELVKEILKYFPDILWFTLKNKLLLHVAIEHRRHNVFNYLIKLTGERRFAFANVEADESGNNILHLAALLAPFEQLYSVSGKALQLQRELQWFKEVEKLAHGTSKWETNKEKKTPQQLFTEQHRELHKEGEKWMKDTAQNCMVVATLVATIVFAAIITVPGGIHGETGTPVVLRKIPFVVFIMADGLAVFSSMTSLLVFLSILTSRYAEEDFLQSLPLKLVGGLSFLLMAIVTMTIAFAAALHIAVHSKFHFSYIFSILLGCVPVILFLWLHLPLYLQVVKSTCGRGIFEQDEQKHWWTKLWRMEKKEHMV